MVQRQRDLPGQGAAELLLLQALLVCEGYPDETLHRAGEEDGVCGGGDIAYGLEAYCLQVYIERSEGCRYVY